MNSKSLCSWEKSHRLPLNPPKIDTELRGIRASSPSSGSGRSVYLILRHPLHPTGEGRHDPLIIWVAMTHPCHSMSPWSPPNSVQSPPPQCSCSLLSHFLTVFSLFAFHLVVLPSRHRSRLLFRLVMSLPSIHSHWLQTVGLFWLVSPRSPEPERKLFSFTLCSSIINIQPSGRSTWQSVQ